MTLGLLGWLLWGGLRALPSGAGPALRGPLWIGLRVSVEALALCLPVGVAAGLWLARFAPRGRRVRALRFALDELAALPAVAYGVAGVVILRALGARGGGDLPAAALLAVMNLPLVVGLSEEALRGVPLELEEASLALGATRAQTAAKVSLPLAWRGLAAAAVLGSGRALAECAPLLCLGAVGARPETLSVWLWRAHDGATGNAGAATAAALLVLIAAATTELGHRLRPRPATTTAPIG